jgi:hypothetical protein
MRRSEWGAVALVVLAAAAVLAGGRFIHPASPVASGIRSGRSISTGWYCPSPPGDVSSVMSTINLDIRPAHLRRSAAGGSKTSAYSETDLPPLRRSAISTADLKLPGAAGVVEAFGAATITDDLVAAVNAGAGAEQCSPQPSDRWYFAFASTTHGWNTYLLVANPFQEEAVVQVRVMGPDFDSVPALLKDLVVPQLSQASIYLSEYVPETQSFGVELTATRGRVVASRYVRAATKDGVRGLSLTGGVPAPATRWMLPGGEVPQGGDEELVVINPSEQEALLQFVFPTDTEQKAPPELSELPVAAGRQVSVKVSDHLTPGTSHGALITSTNNVGVVVEQESIVSLGPTRGFDSVPGLTSGSRRWAMSAGSNFGGADRLAITNYGPQRTTVRIVIITDTARTAPPELSAIPIDPARRTTVDLTPFLGGAIAGVIIDSPSSSIAVENRLTLPDPYRDFYDSIPHS